MEYVKTFGIGNSAIEITVFDKPMEHNVIGLLTSKLFENPMGLVQNEEAKPGEEFCPAYLGIVHENHGIVLLDKGLIDALKQSDRMAEMIMLHEIGHYVHGDYREAHVKDSDAERRKVLQKGGVLQKELNADAFAAEYLGAETVALALSDLKNYFVQNFRGCDAWDMNGIDDTVKELELRIEHIKQGETPQ